MKPCIGCGFCCIDCPCGLATQDPCEHLIPQEDGSFKCAQYPFEHLDTFTQICLAPGEGCGYDGQNSMYRELYLKLKKNG